MPRRISVPDAKAAASCGLAPTAPTRDQSEQQPANRNPVELKNR